MIPASTSTMSTIWLLAHSLLSLAAAGSINVLGQIRPTRVSECLDGSLSLSELTLRCPRADQLIHVVSLELSHVQSCRSDAEVQCRFTVESQSLAVYRCEGRRGQCKLSFNEEAQDAAVRVAGNCRRVNRVDATIQCIEPADIHTMCPPSATSRSDITTPMTLTTPHLTMLKGLYSPNTRCRCRAVPTPNSNIRVELKYADLEQSRRCQHDYLRFNDHDKICGKPNVLSGQAPPLSFRSNEEVVFEFTSDGHLQGRGAWFQLSSEGGAQPKFSLHCEAATGDNFHYTLPSVIENSTVASSPTTNNSPTPSAVVQMAPATVGVIAGGVCLALILLVVSLYCILSRRLSRATAGSEMSECLNSELYDYPQFSGCERKSINGPCDEPDYEDPHTYDCITDNHLNTKLNSPGTRFNSHAPLPAIPQSPPDYLLADCPSHSSSHAGASRAPVPSPRRRVDDDGYMIPRSTEHC